MYTDVNSFAYEKVLGVYLIKAGDTGKNVITIPATGIIEVYAYFFRLLKSAELSPKIFISRSGTTVGGS